MIAQAKKNTSKSVQAPMGACCCHTALLLPNNAATSLAPAPTTASCIAQQHFCSPKCPTTAKT